MARQPILVVIGLAAWTALGAGMQAEPAGSGLAPTQLRCEYLSNPLGIDARQPRLSWVLESSERGQFQNAYQVLVASTPQRLAKGEGDLWDSGKVMSDQSIQVTYAGKPLRAQQWAH